MDYSTADPFTIFGDGCRCGANRNIEPTHERIPPLSQAGVDAAAAYGRSILGDAQTFVRSASLPSHLEFSPPSVEVYIREGGIIYSVDVD